MLVSHSRPEQRSHLPACVKSSVCVCPLLQDLCVCVKSPPSVSHLPCVCLCVCARAKAASLFATGLNPPGSLLA